MKAQITESQLLTIINEVLDERKDKKPINEDLSKSDQDKVTSIVKKEIRDFVGASNSQNFEQLVTKMLKEKIKGDKQIESHLVELTRNVLVQLYKALWVKRNFWTSDLKNNAV